MNFIQSMLSEDGKISHKRWISVTVSLTICFTVLWVVVKYKDLSLDALHSAMIFVLLMSGVATVAQVASILKGSPQDGAKITEKTDISVQKTTETIIPPKTD